MGNPYYTWGNPTILSPLPIGYGPNLRWTVAANQDGHLELFALGHDGAVWHTWQDYMDIFKWSDWASLGSPGGLTILAESMHAVQNADGRIEVFIADDEWNIWHIWQIAPNVNWTAEWSPLGRPISEQSDNSAYTLEVGNNDSGSLTVLMQDLNTGEIFSRSQVEANGNWEPGWTTLGPVQPNFGDFAFAAPPQSLVTQALAYVQNQQGGPGYVFINQRSSFVAGESQWSGWTIPFNGPPGQSYIKNLVLQPNQDNHLELLAFDVDENLWHTWQDDQKVWSQPWANFGAPPNGSLGIFSSALGPGGIISIVSWAGDNAIHVVSQTAPNNGWSGWNTLWANTNPNPIKSQQLKLIADEEGFLNVFGQDSNERLFYIRQVFHKG
jgi:hypothetical protein